MIYLIYSRYIRYIRDISDIFTDTSEISSIYLPYFDKLPPLLLHARFFSLIYWFQTDISPIVWQFSNIPPVVLNILLGSSDIRYICEILSIKIDFSIHSLINIQHFNTIIRGKLLFPFLLLIFT